MDFTLIEARPGITIVLLPDAPKFTIVAVSNDFQELFGVKTNLMIGKGYFDQFPQSPTSPTRHEQNLKESFEYVIEHKQVSRLQQLRYDIIGPDSKLLERYWKTINVPVLDETGDVGYIIYTAEDVTDQVMAEQKVQSIKGLEKGYNLFMNAPVIIGLVKGDEYVIELANEGLLEVWGRTAEVIGQPLLQALPELAEQGFILLLDQVRVTGEPFYAYEYPIKLNRNGKEEVLYFDFVYKPLYENVTDEKAGAVISVGHDVTAQVLARKNVAEISESLNFRNALFEAQNEATPDAVLVVDDKGKMLLHNKRFAEIWQMPQEIIDSKDDEAAQKHATTMVDDPQGFIDRIAYLYSNKNEKSYDLVRFKDGRVIERNGTPIIGDNGFYYGWAWYFRDITERIRQDQRWEKLANAMPVIVWTAYADGRLNFFNDNWYRFTGLTTEESVDYGWARVMHPDDVERCLITWNEAREKEVFYEIEVRYRNKQGEYRWVLARAAPIKNEEGKLTAWYGTSTDIHEQRMLATNLEAIVEERTAELTRSNASLEEFAYAASHDLKEPIRKIHFFADRIKTRLAQKMEADDIILFEKMQYASIRMGTLIDDLLAYSHATTGVTDAEAIDLNVKVKLVLEDLELEIQETGAQITVEPLPAIKGNRRQFQQLFQNLISNALKYRQPDTAPAVHISCLVVEGKEFKSKFALADATKSYYLIEVQDKGIGFEQQHADKIFRIFTRLHGNAEYRGTGVGLSIVKKVAENHYGHVWAESKPGDGASFKILLPVE